MYRFGKGIEKNDESAFYWYQQAKQNLRFPLRIGTILAFGFDNLTSHEIYTLEQDLKKYLNITDI